MAPPSISTRVGWKVSAIQRERSPLTANQSPVATRPVTAGVPRAFNISTQRSGSQVGKATWFTVETRPMGSPTAVVSTSCWTNSEATTRLPVGRSVAQPATPAFRIMSTPKRRQRISAAMAALTLLTPPTQAGIPGAISKKGTPEMVSMGVRSLAPGSAWSSEGMANCSAIFIIAPY